jgi:p-aminobenzoyl-glutamate transporter AbgT
MFWWVVGAVVVVLVALAWWSSGRSKPRLKQRSVSSSDAGANEARVQQRMRDIGGLGPGQGP